MNNTLESMRGGLIVSCQAPEGSPMRRPEIMAAMAQAAERAGACAIRANGEADILAIRKIVKLPVIGIYKVHVDGYETIITPSFQYACILAKAGADLIAFDATQRPHPDQMTAQKVIMEIHAKFNKPILADISTFEEGVLAAEAGADAVLTTLAGYTAYSPAREDPDFELIKKLSQRLDVPVIAEGRIATPEQAVQAFRCGAYAVVVGSAITSPEWITTRFIQAIQKTGGEQH